MPLLASVFDQTRALGVDFVGISLDHDLAQLDAVVADHDLPWPQLGDPRGRDGRLVKLFNVRGTPSFYLLDSEGRIAGKAHETGEIVERLGELVGQEIDTELGG